MVGDSYPRSGRARKRCRSSEADATLAISSVAFYFENRAFFVEGGQGNYEVWLERRDHKWKLVRQHQAGQGDDLYRGQEGEKEYQFKQQKRREIINLEAEGDQ